MKHATALERDYRADAWMSKVNIALVRHVLRRCREIHQHRGHDEHDRRDQISKVALRLSFRAPSSVPIAGFMRRLL